MSDSRSHLDAARHIARAAKRVQAQTTEVDRRVDFIDELASRARSEADKIHDISDQLGAIARSVAMVAIDTCQKPAADDGAQKKRELPLDLDDLLQLLDGKLQEGRGHADANVPASRSGHDEIQKYGRCSDRDRIITPSPSPNQMNTDNFCDGSSSSSSSRTNYVSPEPYTDSPSTVLAAVYPPYTAMRHTDSLRDCIRKVDELTEQYATRIPEFRTVDYAHDPFCDEHAKKDISGMTSGHQQSYRWEYRYENTSTGYSQQPYPYYISNDSPILNGTNYNPRLEYAGFSSADNEVETIISDRRARELKTTKGDDRSRTDASAKWKRRDRSRDRSVSPLLNSEEQGMYTVHVDRGSNSASPKHIFTPIISASDASLNDLPNDNERSRDENEAVNQRVSDVT